MAEVSFIAENATKCMCPSCPVQTQSECVRQQMPGLKEVIKHNPLQAEIVPGLYCASGTAFCKDLNFKKACICASCLVYMQYKLKQGLPVLYFCRDGASH